MEEEKKRRAIKDLRMVIYCNASIMSTGAMQIITALCMGKMKKEEAVDALTYTTRDCTGFRIKAQNWFDNHPMQSMGFVKKYYNEIMLDSNCDAAQVYQDYGGPKDDDVDIKIPIRDIYWVCKKVIWKSNYRNKLMLKSNQWNERDLLPLRIVFMSAIKDTELYRGRKKSQRYTVSRDKDKPAYYISSTGRLGKLPLYKLEKYIKDKIIVLDHNELRATQEISDGQYIKVGSFIEKHLPKIPQETKDMLQKAFEEIKPCHMVIDTNFEKAYAPYYNNHQDTDGDKASNYSCMSGQGTAAQEFYGGIHGCKVVRFETESGDQVGRCIMYEYKGQRHFIRIYGRYEYHRTMLNMLREEMKENDLFGRNECISGMRLETDWTDDTHTMYLDGNCYGISKEETEDGDKYIVCTGYDYDCKTTSNERLEYEYDGDYCTCDNCGGRVSDDDAYWVNDHCYCCSDCVREAGYAYCEYCDEWEWEEDGIWIDGEFYCCDECAEGAGYRRCASCDEWHNKDGMIEVADRWYCDEVCAQDDGWHQCPYCNDWVNDDDEQLVETDDGIYCCKECAEKDGWMKDGEEWKREEDVEEVKEQEPEQSKELSNEG